MKKTISYQFRADPKQGCIGANADAFLEYLKTSELAAPDGPLYFVRTQSGSVLGFVDEEKNQYAMDEAEMIPAARRVNERFPDFECMIRIVRIDCPDDVPETTPVLCETRPCPVCGDDMMPARIAGYYYYAGPTEPLLRIRPYQYRRAVPERQSSQIGGKLNAAIDKLLRKKESRNDENPSGRKVMTEVSYLTGDDDMVQPDCMVCCNCGNVQLKLDRERTAWFRTESAELNGRQNNWEGDN